MRNIIVMQQKPLRYICLNISIFSYLSFFAFPSFAALIRLHLQKPNHYKVANRMNSHILYIKTIQHIPNIFVTISLVILLIFSNKTNAKIHPLPLTLTSNIYNTLNVYLPNIQNASKT